MAPMRAAATHEITHAGSLGNRIPTRAPFTAPASTSRAARWRDLRSRSAKLMRSSGVTRNALSPQRSTDALTALRTVGGKSGKTGSVIVGLSISDSVVGDAHVLDGAQPLDRAGDDVTGHEVARRLLRVPHTGRRAGEDEVAGEQRDDVRQPGHQLGHGEDQLRRAGLLHLGAVDAAADLEIITV